MQIFHFGSDGSLIGKNQSGYVTQYSNNVAYLFAYVDGISSSAIQPTAYVATAVLTPSGATQSVTLALSPDKQTIDGATVYGWSVYLPSSALQVAGPMALSLRIENAAGAVIATAAASIYVTASSTADEWETPINVAQWQELVAYILGMTKDSFLGVLTNLSVLDTLLNNGSYWYVYNGKPYTLHVVGDGTAAAQTRVDYLTPSDTIATRSYSSGSWGAWSVVGDFSGYLPLTGGTMAGDVNFSFSGYPGISFINSASLRTLSINALGMTERKYSGTSQTNFTGYYAGFIQVAQGDSSPNYTLTFPYKTGTFALTSDVSAAQTALQSEIDALSAAQNLVDIVGTYADLQALPTTGLQSGDKVEVMADETHSGATAIYSWTGAAWSYVGSIGPYYTKTESDERYLKLSGGSMAEKASLRFFDNSNATNTTIEPGSVQFSRGSTLNYTEYGPSGIDTYVNDAPALSFALPSESGTLAVTGQVGLLAGNNSWSGTNMFGIMPTYNSSPLLAQTTLADFVDSVKANLAGITQTSYYGTIAYLYKDSVFNGVLYLHAIIRVNFTANVSSGTAITFAQITSNFSLNASYRGTLSFASTLAALTAGSGTDGSFVINQSNMTFTRTLQGTYQSGSVVYMLINAVINK